MRRPLFHINPMLDRAALAAEFAARSRVQIGDLLTREAAESLLSLLQDTAWNLSWRTLGSKPNVLPASAVAADGASTAAIARMVAANLPEQHGVTYVCRDRTVGDRAPSEPGTEFAQLYEAINGPAFLDLMRDVTGEATIRRANARATLYEPGHFLSIHHDGVEDGRHFAFVLNLCAAEWRPDWGGYLLFYDARGDVIEGFRPRFNSLNLFRVPQLHAIPMVVPSAPVARYAVSGWLFDR